MDERDLCLLCGKPAEHDHHVTGRGADRRQLDDTFTVPVCGEDHDLVHADLRTEAIDRPLLAAGSPVQMERRLRRLALFVSRLAETLVIWADDFRTSYPALDEYDDRRDD